MHQKEALIPLTTVQQHILDKNGSDRLTEVQRDFGALGSIDIASAPNGWLKLTIPSYLPVVWALYRLEKSLGVLMTRNEIKQIRNLTEMVRDEEKMDDQAYFDEMMTTLSGQNEFVQHQTNIGLKPYHISLSINTEEKSIEWNGDQHAATPIVDIIRVVLGNGMEFFEAEKFDDIPRDCCFTIVTNRNTFYLTRDDRDGRAVRLFVAYLKGLRRHFSSDLINEFHAERTISVPVINIINCLPTPPQMIAFNEYFKNNGYKEVDV